MRGEDFFRGPPIAIAGPDPMLVSASLIIPSGRRNHPARCPRHGGMGDGRDHAGAALQPR